MKGLQKLMIAVIAAALMLAWTALVLVQKGPEITIKMEKEFLRGMKG